MQTCQVLRKMRINFASYNVGVESHAFGSYIIHILELLLVIHTNISIYANSTKSSMPCQCNRFATWSCSSTPLKLGAIQMWSLLLHLLARLFYPAYIETTDQIVMKILQEIHLWTRKIPLNFRSHSHLDLVLGICWRIFRHCNLQDRAV